ncbi:MAG: sigma 54-interacting transcriptional regulator [Myxococcales bacterium]|nr:sigma 54-interacting transcriptional regulator [Myxococcales bacterium]
MTKRRGERVLFSVVGQRYDAPGQWRPTLVCVQRPDVLEVDRLVLLGQANARATTESLAKAVREVNPAIAVECVTLELRDAWSFEEVYGAFYEFARARTFREEDEHYVHMTTGTHVMQIVWYLLVSEHFVPAKLVQSAPPKRSAKDDRGTIDVLDLDLSRYPAIERRRHRERLEGQSLLKMGIETRSESFDRVIQRLERAALGPAVPILLWGETGVGKSALARRVYALRKQQRTLAGPLVEVNCATLRGTLRESALFGHKRGAFTGADRDRRGYLRAADGGMLFLDEVGELGLEEQAILLTAIEDGRFYPLGSDEPERSSFALVCGTNRDLRADVAAGRFRDDLLARIATWSFRLPPLRERREDIESNARYELEQFEARFHKRARFSRAALAKYLAYAKSDEARWTHNFRDLAQSVLRMASSADEGLIDTDDVDEEIRVLREAWSEPSAARDRRSPVARDDDDRAWDLVDRVVRDVVIDALRASKSLAEAGRVLFDGKRPSKAPAVNYSDRARKLCQRLAIDPSAYLQR